MLHLIFDTNTLIYLSNGYDPLKRRFDVKLQAPLLNKLLAGVTNRQTAVFVSEISINEFNRNKEHTKNYIKALQNKLDHAQSDFTQIFEYANDKNQVQETLINYRAGIIDRINRAKRHIANTEAFIEQYCKVIPVTTVTESLAIELSLKKLPPFHNNKNNIADALILFSVDSYLHKNYSKTKGDFIFISNNTEEFCEKDIDSFHPEIAARLKFKNLKFSRILASSVKLVEMFPSAIQKVFDQFHTSDKRFECTQPYCDDYLTESGKYTALYKVLDEERTSFDPLQLNLFPSIPIAIPVPKYRKFGWCITCGTQHIECPYCSMNTEFDPYGVSTCDFCFSEFKVNSEREEVEIIQDSSL
jgi:hypothetical protein